MPYIPQSDRTLLDESIQELAEEIDSPGELNYIICRLLTLASTKYGRPGYEEMSAWRGAVQDASDEFYRRVMAPYENKKCAENGDVFKPLATASGAEKIDRVEFVEKVLGCGLLPWQKEVLGKPLAGGVDLTGSRQGSTAVRDEQRKLNESQEAPTVPRECDDPNCVVCALCRAHNAPRYGIKIGGTT